MSNETGLTQVANSVPKLFRAKALKARYAASKVWKLCLNGVEGDALVKGNITKMGDTVRFQIFPTLTVYDVSTADGSFTNNQVTPSYADITINKWKAVPADLVDIAATQSVLDWEMEFSNAFGEAISEAQDTDVIGLVSSLTTNDIGAANQPMADGLILFAIRKLDDLKIPQSDRHWVLSPTAAGDLLALDKFSLANTTGFAKGVQVGDGRLTGLYGSDVTVSPLVATSSSARLNFYFHKEAFGVVMQRDFKIEKLARTKLSQPYVGSALYGVATLRDNHAVIVRTQA